MKSKGNQISFVLKASLFISLAVFVGRLSGFFRDFLLAGKLGVSVQADAAILILTLPDLLLNLITGGAMTYVLIPEFSSKSSRELFHALQRLGLVSVFIFGALALIMASVSGSLVKVLAPGFSDGMVAFTSTLVKSVLLVLPLSSLTAVTTAFLQSRQRFTVSSLGTLIYNSGLVIVFLTVPNNRILEVLPWVVLAASGTRLLSQLAEIGFFVAPKTPKSSESTSQPSVFSTGLWIRFVQSVCAGSLLFLLPAGARTLASLEGPGEVSLISYGMKFVEIPVGMFLSNIALVLFTRFSSSFQQDADSLEFIEAGILARHGFRSMVFLSVAMMAALILGTLVLADLNLSWKALTSDQVKRLFLLASVLFIAVPGHAIGLFTTAFFNSKKRYKEPLIANIFGALMFFGLGASFRLKWGLYGIACAYVGCQYTIASTQVLFLTRTYKIHCLSWLKDSGFLLHAASAGILSVTTGVIIRLFPLATFIRLGLVIGCSGVLLLLCLKFVRQPDSAVGC